MSKKNDSGVKRALLVGDLHVGSYYGLCSPTWVLDGGGLYTANSGQKYLHSCWNHMIKEMPYCDVAVLNGDLIDGRGLFRGTISSDRVTPNVLEQAREAVRVLTPLKKKVGKFYIISGTESHDQQGGEAANLIGELLGAEKYSSGTYAVDSAFIRIGGFNIHAQHTMDTSVVPFYRANQMGRLMMLAALLGRKCDELDADLIVRSHVHYYLNLNFTSQVGLVLGAWQLQTPYMRRKNFFSMIPRIGGVVAEFDKSNWARPITINAYNYDYPKEQFEVVEA